MVQSRIELPRKDIGICILEKKNIRDKILMRHSPVILGKLRALVFYETARILKTNMSHTQSITFFVFHLLSNTNCKTLIQNKTIPDECRAIELP